MKPFRYPSPQLRLSGQKQEWVVDYDGDEVKYDKPPSAKEIARTYEAKKAEKARPARRPRKADQ